MIDHLGVQVANVEASLAFYLQTFAAIGLREAMRFPMRGLLRRGPERRRRHTRLLAQPGGRPETRELHVAFTAQDRPAVDAVHQAALAAGTEVLHAPREWPEYHPGYYGVFLRDPDGHNVEAVCHRS